MKTKRLKKLLMGMGLSRNQVNHWKGRLRCQSIRLRHHGRRYAGDS